MTTVPPPHPTQQQVDFRLAQLQMNWPEPMAPSDEPIPVPIPPVIAWETLGPFEYRAEMMNLDVWVRWLITVYDVPSSAIPDCWFQHSALVHDLSHLRSAWLLTRHPDAGVANAGVDWDRWRDATFQRFIAGMVTDKCAAGDHMPRSTRTLPTYQGIDSHIDQTNIWLTQQTTWLAAVAGAQNTLADAEQVSESIQDALHTVPESEDDDAATAHVVGLIQRLLAESVADAHATAAEDLDLANSLAADTTKRGELENLRRGLAAAIAHALNSGQVVDPSRWLRAVTDVADLERAVAAAIRLREHTTTAAAAAQNRHPGIADLLGDETD